MTSDREVNDVDRDTPEEEDAEAREARRPDSERVEPVDDPDAPGLSVDDEESPEAVEPNEPA
jgi:hypothetical protein